MSDKGIQGRIEVSPSAVATIANQAVLSSYGIVAMSTKNLVNGLAQVLRPDSKRGVEVHIDQDEITIDLYVVIEHGLRIATVARNIISSVKFSVEKAIGVPVSSVNVHVQGIHVTGAPTTTDQGDRPAGQDAPDARSRAEVRKGRARSGGKSRER